MSRIFKSTAIVSSMTLISRLFGYLRDMVLAITFGASGATDAFFVAFRIPNFLRRLFAEGAFSQAFVPVFAEYREKRGAAALKDLVDHVSGALTLVLFLVTAVGIIAAPVLISIFAPGFQGDDGRHVLAAEMLRITFPYLLFISLTAMAGGILNSLGRFAVPAFTPVFLNLSLIVAALYGAPYFSEPVVALAWGVFAAGAIQLAFQIPFLMRHGLLPRPRWRRAHEGVKRIFRLMLPAIFGTSVVQINLLIDTLIASFLMAGSITWLYFSDRFVELPLALFGIAIATVILPRLSKEHAQSNRQGFSQTLDWALRLAVLIAIPSALGLILLATPILASLIQYREFLASDTHMAALSLMAYAAGLPGFMLIKILAPGYFSRQDTKTPVKVAVIAMLANIILNIAIVVPWVMLGWAGPHAGLALATTLSAYLNALLLFLGLRRSGILTLNPGWRSFLLRILTANALLVGLLLWMLPDVTLWSQWLAPQRLTQLLLLIAAGALTYILALLALGLRPRQFLLSGE
ncbi:putative peptidoglycan lipid II flippase [Ectothiorhodosinus mongolicus]|uniref:Probable lipid II flippase MurJ n=1 Tax=Ectothiorhodosinus mongolicus TaxID=233100 RepID=A0A1R3W2S4_9GAMM|nr:murein biosynthesis integral membrane protein MurJ [Ectothiorhodosinus mongolicus]ULX57163.1 murein biosynthesis integral membrane protein MurJ [Ectothiorhodosinus mongolicus]SIT70205.1 putative peptidoglycan lipid II flippase [Ectothiorhodosinus mongolicus]